MKKSILLIFLNFLVVNSLSAQWTQMGSADFSAGSAYYHNMAVDTNGVFYLIYMDTNFSQKAVVKKFNGTSWVTVGANGLSAGSAQYTRIAINPVTNEPYVAYNDEANSGNPTVRKFNGTSWQTVGSLFTTNATYESLAFDKYGTPYVAFRNESNNNKACVIKFDGSAWDTVGDYGISEGGAYYVNLQIDKAGNLYVGYCDVAHSNKQTVMKYDGTSWATVGSAGFSGGSSSDNCLRLDTSGTPYVAYTDAANSYKLSVKKFTSGSWVNVGNAGISTDMCMSNVMHITPDGTIYIGYIDVGAGFKMTVIKYNGSTWATVGSAGFTPLTASNPAITWYNGTVYAAFQNASFGGRSNVMKITDCTAVTWYQDTDEDGYGNLAVSQSACNKPTGYVSNSSDCNDNDNTVTLKTVWYRDNDEDSYGDVTTTLSSCTIPTGYVANHQDCDDTNPLVYSSVPTNLTLGKITTTTAIITWDEAGCAAVWQTRRSPQGQNAWVRATTNTNSRKLVGLSSGITYDWQVRAVYGVEDTSAWSGTQNFTTECANATNLRVTHITYSSAKLNWDNNNTGVKRIRYRLQGTITWTTIITNNLVAGALLNGLSSSATYEWSMRTACTNENLSGWSAVLTFTTKEADERLEEETTLGEKAADRIMVYPNPATNQLTVSSEQLAANSLITISDVLGRVILQSAAHNALSTIMDISALARGVYMLRVQTAEGTETVKVVKE